uniref:Uncharacterized protein n=1 Tax=Tetranychus urticae TaxID=32264 RepID=T1L3Y1_TETUR
MNPQELLNRLKLMLNQENLL